MSSKIIESIAYSYIGRLVEPYLAEFEGLKLTLRKAGVEKSVRMYLSVRIFWAIILAIVSLVSLIAIYIIVPGFSVILVIILPVLVLTSMFVYTWVYPSYLVGERKTKLEAALPTAASYMTAMASAGVTPDRIFLSLTKEKIGEAIVKDAKKISRDIQVFGYDIVLALSEASLRSPSPKYSSFLEGIIGTFTSGGELQRFLEVSSETLMNDKVQSEKNFIETLGIMAELFMVLGVVSPIFFIVILAMMSMLGGSATNSTLLMALLVYVIIPVSEMAIIVLIDAQQPEI
ncbi:MAG: type II secretion system F family protein [Candidatus Heimdallarchaeota archaeon]|nr:type II secretion system F family protein [Candidatus Heimdallarchaeota archaeon]